MSVFQTKMEMSNTYITTGRWLFLLLITSMDCQSLVLHTLVSESESRETSRRRTGILYLDLISLLWMRIQKVQNDRLMVKTSAERWQPIFFDTRIDSILL